MNILTIILAAALDVVPSGEVFLEPLQPRDSILVADQLEYGFTLDSIPAGTGIALPDFKELSNDTLTVVRGWQIDTLRSGRRGRHAGNGPFNLRVSVILAPFEPGEYRLPAVPVVKIGGGSADTLLFEGTVMKVTEPQVDTATFEIRDIKGQIRYPVTFRELLPWGGGILLLAALVILGIWLFRKYGPKSVEQQHKDPPHIIALREIDKYRSDKYWAPERQKAFYSGITDALKNYIDARFGVDAPEMTTAELFAALKGEKDITPELYCEMKDLFERADFIKFAKMTVGDEENSKVLPAAVKFVTSTYQAEIEEESGEEAAVKH